MHGSHAIKAYSRTQSTLALSSAEAEFYALTSEGSEGLGTAAMMEDYGDKLEVFMYADASAAIGVANREGLGRIRHLDVQSLESSCLRSGETSKQTATIHFSCERSTADSAMRCVGRSLNSFENGRLISRPTTIHSVDAPL